MKKNKTYLIVTLVVFALIFLPSLVRDGMFVDGVTYSGIAKNMAEGKGSFWSPHYTKTFHPEFYEHPPMVFIIQSLFFRILGDAFYTEKVYCLFILILSILGIIQCWKLVVEQTVFKKQYYLPLLLWIFVPLVAWSYKNNLLENTMGVFTLFATYFIVLAFKKSQIMYLMLGAFCTILAFLCKGFVALFPLALPLIYGMVYQEKKAIGYFLFLIASVASIGFLWMTLEPEMKHNISSYIDTQLLPALKNEREITTKNRWNILWGLMLELLIPIIIISLFFVLQEWRKKHLFSITKNKDFLFFLLIALSASVPLIISFKQRNFYTIPSIPFYALALGALSVPFIHEKLAALPERYLKWTQNISYVALGGVLLFSILNFGTIARNKEILTDAHIVSKHIPKGTILSTNREVWQDWHLVAYINRIGYLSLDFLGEYEYYIIKKDTPSPLGYEVLDVPLENYVLLKKTKH